MSENPKYIYLQPECCADSCGRLWCEDPDPVDCEHGALRWTKYILFEEHKELVDEYIKYSDSL